MVMLLDMGKVIGWIAALMLLCSQAQAKARGGWFCYSAALQSPDWDHQGEIDKCERTVKRCLADASHQKERFTERGVEFILTGQVCAFQEKAYSFAFYRPEESGVGAFPLLKSCQQVAQIVVTQNPDAIITRQCALTP
ncbi:MAG TPA: hypothetical protein VIQ54_21530 [Polyangia bacterium]|jgi:hypothetical protein